MHLSETLIARGLVTADNIDAARKQQRRRGGRLRDIIVEMGLLTASELAAAAAKQQKPALPRHQPVMGGLRRGGFIDLTERGADKRLPNETNLQFDSLVGNASDLISVIRRDGTISYVSPAIREIGGCTSEQVLGGSFFALVHPDDVSAARSSLSALLQRPGEQLHIDLRLQRKDGSICYTECVARNLLDVAPVNGIVMCSRDVTERTLDRSRIGRLVAMVEGANEAIIGATLEGVITDWNRAAGELYGYSWKEVSGQSVTMLIPPEDREDVAARIRKMRAGEIIRHDEGVSVRKDGSRFAFSLTLSHITDARGVPIGVSAIVRDISAQKAAEIGLERLNRALKMLSRANEVLVRATSEPSLLKEMCTVIIERGGYRMSWIGIPRDDSAKTVEPVAWEGEDEGYLQNVNFSWADDDYGQGIAGLAIKTGKMQINRKLSTDERMAPWESAAQQHGFVSSIALPLKDASAVIAVLMINAAQADAFNAEECELLEQLAADLAFGLCALRSRVATEAAEHRRRESLQATVAAIASTVEIRDPYTAGHQRRVAELAVAIADEMGLPEERRQGLYLAAVIHDVGKISVPFEILNKPGKLSPWEFEIIKTHVTSGYDIVKGIDFPWPIAQIVLQHHERLDGSGYPNGIKGDDIQIEARILAVADTVDAIMSHRPYRPALGPEAALAEIRRGMGRIYDTAVVEACLAVVSRADRPLEHGRYPASSGLPASAEIKDLQH